MIALLAENGILYSHLVRTFAGRDAAGSQGATAEDVLRPSRTARPASVRDHGQRRRRAPLLEQERPDLAEVRAALADIVDDAGRAGETLRGAQRMLAGARRAPAGTGRSRPSGCRPGGGG